MGKALLVAAAAALLAAGGLALAFGDDAAMTTTARIQVDTAKGGSAISPYIYGHFTEHLGGVIYDGIWVGRDSKVPNVNGIRKDLIEHLKRIDAPVIRWPGGCFADSYHWRDGIGHPSKRPVRYGRWADASEPNTFGTHEFLEFCKLSGAKPYIAANVGNGSPEEFQNWIEYCNAPAGSTTLAKEREANGHREPFGVTFWGVGNEAWGCGGGFSPEDYCVEFRKFSTWVPGFGLPLYLIACGPSSNDTNWTKRFFDKLQDYRTVTPNGWAPHYYCGTAGSALEFTNDQWYELIARSAEIEKLITDQWATLEPRDPEHHVKLVIDEWGAWHPPGTEINKAHLLEQMSTLRDAMIAAVTLDTFNRHSDKVYMANIAQLVNNLHSLFLADGPKFVATPNFYVFEMYKVHQGAQSLPLVISGPESSFNAGGERRMPSLSGSASVKDGKLHISVTNVDLERPVETSISLGDVKVSDARQTLITASDIHAHNTFEAPCDVASTTTPISLQKGELKHAFPPASITMLELTLE